MCFVICCRCVLVSAISFIPIPFSHQDVKSSSSSRAMGVRYDKCWGRMGLGVRVEGVSGSALVRVFAVQSWSTLY